MYFRLLLSLAFSYFTHTARHNFGTLLLSAGISIESIAKMMGHANISTTQGYAKVTDDKISEDMDRLMQRRKTKQNGAVQTKFISNEPTNISIPINSVNL